MGSESEVPVSLLIERLMAMPFFSGFTPTRPESDSSNDSEHPDHESTNSHHPGSSPDRIILINPMTQGMVVIRGSSTGFDSLMNDLMRKDGQPPASQTSIDTMPSVEIKGTDELECLEGECVICLEEWGVGDVVKEMPCKHKFHGGCVEKWLKIHGSCPVCRHQMPVDCSDKKTGDEGVRGRREIWVTFSFADGRSTSEGSVESNQESTKEPFNNSFTLVSHPNVLIFQRRKFADLQLPTAKIKQRGGVTVVNFQVFNKAYLSNNPLLNSLLLDGLGGILQSYPLKYRTPKSGLQRASKPHWLKDEPRRGLGFAEARNGSQKSGKMPKYHGLDIRRNQDLTS
ncbi:hypothetical protein LXL04_021056 [Taraxacum kok-saghyz]